MTTTLAKGPGGTPPALAGRESADANRRRITRVAFGLLAPTLIAMAIVVVYPIIVSIINSLQTDFAAIDPKTGLFEKGGFVGLQNYTNWLLQQCQSGGKTITCPAGTNQSEFYDSIFATFFFTVVTVALETVIGMWMALIMNRNFRGRGILRAAVLVPWAIPTAVTAQLWYFIFATNGVLNSVLHINTLWTADLWASRWAIIIADTWKTTPFMALLILAGPPADPRGHLRGRAHGRRDHRAGVLPDHAPAGPARARRRDPVPHARRAPDVRPAGDPHPGRWRRR